MPKILKEESLIPNGLIEEMFLRISTEDQVKTYMNLIENKHIAVATSYASKRLKEVFDLLVTKYESDYGSVENLSKIVKRKVA